ncbi:adhesion G-protein coupled receptor G5-like [Odontesthes bonariensis]|uniref:adhesion G-protein coupled receptor G5-like n=1 Tax=Odontesthes bonariensis TaxID=219752 RepID=UPI003F584B45
MFLKGTMVNILLLLLLHESLAEQVCINISNYDLNIAATNGVILDEKNNIVKCENDSLPCLFVCTYDNEMWFNESSACLAASVKGEPLTRFEYDIHTYSNCYQYMCINSTILPLIHTLSCQGCGAEEMMKLFYIRNSCPELFRTSHEVKKAFIKAEKHIIHSIMNTSQLENTSHVNHNLKDVSMKVVNISDDALSCTGASPTIKIEAHPLLPQNESSLPEIWMPVNTLRTIPQKERKIGFVCYMQHSHFLFNKENIQSTVLRIELSGERRLQNLKSPIKMIFRDVQTDKDNRSHLVCHYFDEYDWAWKTGGCKTQNNETNIICSCNHTTAFAVLLIREPIAKAHWEILSYISYIGCGLSAFFCALSLVTYVFNRNHKMDYSIPIHVSLSGALFLLNTTFLLTEWGALVNSEWVCECVAALMHYSLLCCFTWMAIEAFHLYLLLIKVFNTHYKYYLLKLSLVGWGFPAVIVATSLGLKDFKQFYGVTHLSMSDTNQTNAICWITDDSFFYSVNLVYFSLIFIFNSGILMAVASRICKMKQVLKNNSKFKAETKGKSWGDAQRFSASCKSGLTLLGITSLMGTTWGLAFLGSGFVNYLILYLFCILNSLQGFSIFLWICLSTKKQRKREMEEKLCSTPMRTSGVKSE